MIDDDEMLCKMMNEYFSIENIDLDFCITGKSWPVLLKRHTYDAIILDLALPEENGLTILKKIVAASDIPVLLLTAQGSDVDHIFALELGAADYIDKPCNPKVLVSRIKKTINNRHNNHQTSLNQEIKMGNLIVNINERRACINHQEVKLTVTEFKILELLTSVKGKGFTKNEISLFALGRKTVEFDRSLDAHIYKLRKKLEGVPDSKVTIATLYGYGYKLEAHS